MIHIEIQHSFEDALTSALEATQLPLDELHIYTAYAGGGAWAKYLICNSEGEILTTCADQSSSWIPIGDNIHELQNLFRTCSIECATSHGPGSHNALCNAWVSGPLHPYNLLPSPHSAAHRRHLPIVSSLPNHQ